MTSCKWSRLAFFIYVTSWVKVSSKHLICKIYLKDIVRCRLFAVCGDSFGPFLGAIFESFQPKVDRIFVTVVQQWGPETSKDIIAGNGNDILKKVSSTNLRYVTFWAHQKVWSSGVWNTELVRNSNGRGMFCFPISWQMAAILFCFLMVWTIGPHNFWLA